jgi:hypothetical protein
MHSPPRAPLRCPRFVLQLRLCQAYEQAWREKVRYEDAPLEIGGRRWRIEGNKLLLRFRGDTGLETSESTITSFTTKQFITEADGHKRTYDWAP